MACPEVGISNHIAIYKCVKSTGCTPHTNTIVTCQLCLNKVYICLFYFWQHGLWDLSSLRLNLGHSSESTES